MAKRNAMIVVAAWLAASAGFAAEFPLTLKTLDPDKDSPYLSQCYTCTKFMREEPGGLAKAPKASSKNALYCVAPLEGAKPKWIMRLDESEEGKGLDILILDANFNGDLTDDPVVRTKPNQGPQGSASAASSSVKFGPISVPISVKPGAPAATIYVESRLENASNRLAPPPGAPSSDLPAWHPHLQAAYAMSADVELDGVKETVLFLDANPNLRFDDLPQAKESSSASGGPQRYYGDEDSVVRDRDGSGVPKPDLAASAMEPFCPVMYFGGKPYSVRVAEDLSKVAVDPYDGPLCDFDATGLNDVRCLTLDWRQSDQAAELLTLWPVKGQVKIPAGEYGLYTCVLAAKGPDGAVEAVASGTARAKPKWVKAKPGKSITIACGQPIELRVKAESGPARLSAGSSSKIDSGKSLEISVEAVGAGGETYSLFAKGPNLTARADPPSFKVFDTNGKTLADGRLEYG